ncbi:hypothetical protein ACFLV2_03180 [Chloroflexota bacterium]
MDKKPFWVVIKNFVVEVSWGYKTQTGTTTRWAWVQLLLSIAFFFIALSLAIIALAFGVDTMPIGLYYAFLIMAGMAILLGLIFIVLALRMGYHWYSIGSQDPTATKSDIHKSTKTIKAEIRKKQKETE